MGHAVVVGGGLAGMLAARALTPTYDRVTVLDRGRWTDRDRPRTGVPHGRHAHGMVASGGRALEQLLPGITDELVARGAVRGAVQGEAGCFLGGLGGGRGGPPAVLASRLLLESAVRDRVTALPGVSLREGIGVAGLILEDGRVAGVEDFTCEGAAGPVGRLGADLVVDASGRRSQAAAWLTRRGLSAPRADRVEVRIRYASRWFARRPGELDGLLGLAHGPTPEAPRGAVVLAQEGPRWVVGLCGYAGDQPSLHLDRFVARARETSPPVGALVERARPLDDGVAFGLQACVRLRLDRYPEHPDGFVAVGDALCGLNPFYGQGVGLAADEALALRAVAGDPRGLPARFYAAARPAVDAAWRASTAADLALPGVTESPAAALRESTLSK